MRPLSYLTVLFVTIQSLFLPSIIQAQQIANLKGVVLTADGKGAEGVSVTLKGLNRGASTDVDGHYEIKQVPFGSYTLRVTALGLNTQELQIKVDDLEVDVQTIILTESAATLSEVVVNGVGANPYTRRKSNFVSKLPLNNLENPQVYTTITKEVLRDQIVTNFNDALKNSSGLDKLWSSTGRSGDGAAYFTLRGFSTQPNLINGVAALTNGDLDPANIEQIEVVKGPSGTLYGGALVNFGGLINIVTKRPLDTVGGEVSYTIGNYAQHRATLDLYGPLNQKKNLLGRVNAAYHKQNSFQDAGFRKSFFIAPSLEYRATSRLTLNLDAELYHYEGTNPLMIFLNRTRPLHANTPDELQFDYNRSYTHDDVTFKTPTINLRGQALYKISDQWTSRTQVNYNRRKTDGYYQYVMYTDVNNERLGTIANDTILSRYVTKQNAVSEVINIQQNFTGDFKIGGLRNRLVFGLDYLRQVNKNNNAPYIVFDRLNSSIDDPNYYNYNKEAIDERLAASTGPYTYNRASSNVYGAYLSNVLNITDQLIAMASVRVDRFQSGGTENLNTGVVTGDYGQTAVSPKFGVVYQVIPNQISIFANYMNGFRNVAPVTQPLPDIPNTFKPQQANQWEGGVKLDVLDNRLSFTASYYDISVKNITRTESIIRDDTTYNITVQNGTQLSRGFELDLTARPVEGLNIIFGYSNNTSKITNADVNVNDRRPVSAGPKHLLNYWVSYRFHQGAIKGIGLGFGGNSASENIITNDLRTGTFTLPGYTVLNASVFYDHPKFRIGLKMDNLTDKEYFKGWTTIEPQMPRSFLANLTYKF
ncbi:TonB-dependent siderophore receptor [Olivibacter jilunii]|uniref:TonB-dependent siderophore receptor n=1 Tax=Olivibacter jilunii TaxID=985016 RepID=UPI003F145B4A